MALPDFDVLAKKLVEHILDGMLITREKLPARFRTEPSRLGLEFCRRINQWIGRDREKVLVLAQAVACHGLKRSHIRHGLQADALAAGEKSIHYYALSLQQVVVEPPLFSVLV